MNYNFNILFMKNIKSNSKFWIAAFIAAPLVNFAQEGQATSSTYFSNALFNTLLVVIILLVLVIVGLANVLKNLAQSDYFQTKLKEEKEKNSNAAKIGAVIGLTFLSSYLNAQTAAPVKDDWQIGGLEPFTFYFLVFIIVIEIFFIVGLYSTIKKLLESDEAEVVSVAKVKPVEKTIFDKLNAAVEIEREQDILMDHDYDGIKELDNDLPPWWKYGFYLTIVVAFVYLVNYHIAGTGDLQTAEYNKEMAKAKADIAEYMKTAANNVDETNVKMLEGTSDIEAGKQLFTANCAACHGKLGEGGVGPNFADEYWLHGGSVADIFKTIKYGYADKGMKSWKEDLSPIQIAQVASFIRTLKGTNPPNGKAPQGDLYKEDGAVASDSTAVGNDSLKVVVPSDSLAKPSVETKK